MARRMIYTDDITNEEGASTRYFSFGRDAYEVDLTDEGYDELAEVLRPWLEAARRGGTNQNFPKDARAKAAATTAATHESAKRHTPEEIDACRAFATEHGIPLGEGRGRIPSRIWMAYHKNDPSLLVEPTRRQARAQNDGEGQLQFGKAS